MRPVNYPHMSPNYYGAPKVDKRSADVTRQDLYHAKVRRHIKRKLRLILTSKASAEYLRVFDLEFLNDLNIKQLETLFNFLEYRKQ